MTMSRSSFLLPVIASATAVAVGVGAFFVAAPFAQPQSVPPTFEPAFAVPPASPITELGARADEGDGALELEPTATVTTADLGSPQSLLAAMRSRLIELDAPILAAATPDTADDSPEGRGPILPDRVTLARLGLGTVDPCAILDRDAAIERGCPSGAAGTVLDTDFTPRLTLWANYEADCNPAVPDPRSVSFPTALVWAIHSSAPVTLTIRYEVSREAREMVVVTTEAARTAWEDAGGTGWIENCITLPDLSRGWSGNVDVRGVSDLGARAERRVPLRLFGSQAPPPSMVEPLSNSGMMMSVATEQNADVRFAAFVVPFGRPARACDFDTDGRSIPSFAQFEEEVSETFLVERGLDPSYRERHTAGFVLPEASTITLCAGWGFRGAGSNVPTNTFSEVWNSPDLTMPVVSVSTAIMDPRVAAAAVDDIVLTGFVGDTGNECGQWRPRGENSPALCDYTVGQAATPSWDLPLGLKTVTTAFGSTAKHFYTIPVYPKVCGVGCVTPEPEFYDISFESRNPCLGNGCGESRAGSVRLRVDWVDGQDSWADTWLREDAPAPVSTAPVFDRNTGVTLGVVSADRLSQTVELRVSTDREASVVLRLVETSRWPVVSEREIVDPEFRRSRVMRFDVPTGSTFSMLVEVTSRDGTTNVYAADPRRGRTWAGGVFATSLINLDVQASIVIQQPGGEPVAYRNYLLTVAGTEWQSSRGRYAAMTCDPDLTPIDLGEPKAVPGLTSVFRYTLDIETVNPIDFDSQPRDCAEQLRIAARLGFSSGVSPGMLRVPSARLGIEQLLSGVTSTYREGPYVVTVSMRAVPRT